MELTKAQKHVVLDYVRCIDPKGILENDHDEFDGYEWDDAWDAIYDFLQEVSQND